MELCESVACSIIFILLPVFHHIPRSRQRGTFAATVLCGGLDRGRVGVATGQCQYRHDIHFVHQGLFGKPHSTWPDKRAQQKAVTHSPTQGSKLSWA
jgi:hypothetical protein